MLCIQLCTVQRARIVCTGIFLVIAVFIAPYHMLWVHRYPAPYEACLVLQEHEEAFTALYLAESILFRIAPVFAIAILNVFIIVRVWRIIRKRKLMASSTQSGHPSTKHNKPELTSHRDANTNHRPCTSLEPIDELRESNVDEQATHSETPPPRNGREVPTADNGTIWTRDPQTGREVNARDGGMEMETIQLAKRTSTKATAAAKTSNGRWEDKSLQMTIMLIIVSTSYVLAYMPTLAHFFIWKLERLHVVDLSDRAVLIAQNYTRPLYVAGFAINFFLYTVSGPVFRRQLVRVVGCGPSDWKRGDTAATTAAAAAAAAAGCGRCHQRPSRV